MNRAKNVMGVLGFLFLWELVTVIKKNPALPRLFSILETLFKSLYQGLYTKHILASMEVALYGLLIAVLGAFFLGIILYQYNSIKQVAMPIVDSIRSVSGLVLLPLLVILFGVGKISRIIIIFWTAWPAVLISTMHSLNIDRDVVEAAQIDGAGKWLIMLRIRIPVALSGIMTGVRIGVWGGWISLVTAEMLGASSGLGFYLMLMSQSFNFKQVYSLIILIVAIGTMINIALNAVQRLIDNRREKGEQRDEKGYSFIGSTIAGYRNNLFSGLQKR